MRPLADRRGDRRLARGVSWPRLGFTLVELLVVIGIIALLMALLMPSLSKAVEIAHRTICAARLQQQLLAAQVHAADHRGYYPLAGVLSVEWPPPSDPKAVPNEGLEPQFLEDSDGVKYDYFSFPYPPPGSGFPADVFQRLLAPITVSLGSEMSFKSILYLPSNDAVGAAEGDDAGLGRAFCCPSHATSTSEFLRPPMVYYYIPPNGNGESPGVYDTEPTSYMYNEVVLGWGNQQATQGACDTSGRLHGKASLVRQTSKTMFVADGLGGYVSNSIRFQNSITGCPMATVYNADYNGATIPPITLADAYLGTGGPDDKAGDNESFDLHRHRGKINIGFCDGHVETRNISVSDLSSVYLMAP